MILNFFFNNDFFNVTCNNKELIFDANLLNFIFINGNDINVLSVSKNEDLTNLEKLIHESEVCIIFTYNINYEIKIPFTLEYYEFFYLPFVKLGFFWYGIIRDNKIYNEGIKNEIEENFTISLDGVVENKIVEDEYQKFSLEVSNLRREINSLVIQDLDEKFLHIKNFYNNLNIIIGKTKNNYDSILDNTNSKIRELKLLESQLKDKIIVNNQKNLINTKINNKTIELLQLQTYLDNLEEKNKNKIEKLNHLNKIIENKTLIASKLDNQIYNLVSKKKKLEFEVSNNISDDSLELEKIIINKKKNNYKIAVCIHLYNYKLFDEFQDYLKILKNVIEKYDLYINIVHHEVDKNQTYLKKIIKKIRDENKSENLYITCSHNKGLDIGGFLRSFDKMLELGKKYDSIIKIHTKTNYNWRFAMIYSLLGSEKIIKHNLELLKKDEIGMIGNQVFNINLSNKKKKVINYLLDYMLELKISPKINCEFIPGTIFWIKGGILEKFLTRELINKYINEFKPYYCGFTNRKIEGKPHAFERLFGVMVKGTGKEVVKFDT